MSNPVGAQRYGLGGGDAYYDAVKYGGYTGTREQFGRDQAEFAQNATAVAQAKEEVERNTQTVVNTAQTFTEETVPAAIQSVEEKADTEEDRLELRTTELVEAVNTVGAVQVQTVEDEGTEQIGLVSGAGTAQVEAVEQAGITQVQAVNDAGTTQVGNVNQAGEDQVDAVEQAGAGQVQAVTDEGTTQVGAVTGEGDTQVQRVQDKGDEVIDSIPSDYTELAEEVDNLKAAFNVLGDDYELALGTWENHAFVAWNKRIANRYAIDVKKNDIITVLSTTLRWNLGIYPLNGQTTDQNTGWLEPSETTHTVVAQFDGKMFLIFAKTSGDTMSLSDYDAIVHIYNTVNGHLESLTTANSIKIDSVDDDLTDIVNTQKFTLFDEAISLTTFADIPVNWPAGTYDFYASAFVSSDTDVNLCRIYLRSSNNTDIYTWDNARNVEINRVVTSDVPVATLRIYAGTSYSNSSGDTLTISQLSVRLRTALSNRMDSIETDITQNRKNIDQVKINQKFLSDLFLHDKFFSHLGIAQTSNIIIPPQSIADVARTKRLGFKALELNCRKTRDGQYVCLHGIQGGFGYQFTDINGNSVRDVLVNSMTLQEIKDGIRFKSNYQKYRTAPFTLQEILSECKKLNIVPLIEFQPSYTDIFEIADRIMGKDNYFVNIYNVNRSQANTDAPLSSWLAIADSSSLVSKCETSGGIYYAGINVTNSVYADFTDANWKSLADAVHLAGYKIGFLAGYASESLSQRLLNLGFDYVGSLWRINEIENGNLCNLFAGSDFVTGFNTNGTVANGTLTLAEGNTITPKAQLNSVFLGGGSLHIAYSGSIRVQFGEYIDATFTNSDGSDQWFSTYFEESAPTFTITATAETTVYDITYKASEM